MRRARRPALPTAFVVALLAVGLGACGGEDGSAARPDPDAPTNVTITVEGSTATRAFTLSCDPVGGTWSAREDVCRRLATPEGRAALDPIERETRDRVRISPVVLTISGRVANEDVRLDIPREGSGTRLVRFREVEALLGPGALASVIDELTA